MITNKTTTEIKINSFRGIVEFSNDKITKIRIENLSIATDDKSILELAPSTCYGTDFKFNAAKKDFGNFIRDLCNVIARDLEILQSVNE